MPSTIKIAIFASGSGSNAENIANYFSSNSNIIIDSIYTNKSDAFVIERAKKLSIPCYYFPNQDFRQGDALLAKLQERNIDFIVLAGFLLRIPENILGEFPNKILNIHPALLPKYGGKGMYGDRVHQAVKESGDKESGITIHYVNERYDEGATIFQAKCEVLQNDNADDIAQKVHILEYENFPKVIEDVINEVFF